MTNDAPGVPRFRWFIGACIVLILMGVAHAVAANFGKVPEGEDWATFDRLARTLVVPDVNRTMEQVERGFGWFFTLASVVIAAGGLVLLPIARREPAIVRRLAVVYTAGCAAFLAVSLVYWFIVPTSFLSLSMILFLVSSFRDGRARPA